MGPKLNIIDRTHSLMVVLIFFFMEYPKNPLFLVSLLVEDLTAFSVSMRVIRYFLCAKAWSG